MEMEKGSLLVRSSETTGDSARDDKTTRSEENSSSRSDNVTDIFANGPDYIAVSALVKTVTETVLDSVGHENEKKVVEHNVDRDETIGYRLLDLQASSRREPIAAATTVAGSQAGVFDWDGQAQAKWKILIKTSRSRP